MKSIIRYLFVLCGILLWSSASAETWVHIYGKSWHNQPGYREVNTGIGIEQKFADKWSWSLGTFQNSIDRQSVVGMAKYHWYQQGNLSVNLQMGAVTGYQNYSVAPVLLPEACWKWVCGMFVPEIKNETAAATVVYLRIPL